MQLLEPSPQHRRLLLTLRITGRAAHQHADPPHPLALLRARRRYRAQKDPQGDRGDAEKANEVRARTHGARIFVLLSTAVNRLV